MCSNFLKLKDKTEVLIVGLDELSGKIQPALGPLVPNVKLSVRNQGLIFDPCLNFTMHILKLAQCGFI